MDLKQHTNQNWYVVYTKTNSERILHDSLVAFSNANKLGYKAFLPLTTQVRQWTDRQVQRQVPLFKNYLFVQHDEQGFSKLKTLPGYAEYVRFGQYPSVVPQAQIDLISTALCHFKDTQCQPSRLLKGDKVQIVAGRLSGQQGVLLRNQQQNRVALSQLSAAPIHVQRALRAMRYQLRWPDILMFPHLRCSEF